VSEQGLDFLGFNNHIYLS